MPEDTWDVARSSSSKTQSGEFLISYMKNNTACLLTHPLQPTPPPPRGIRSWHLGPSTGQVQKGDAAPHLWLSDGVLATRFRSSLQNSDFWKFRQRHISVSFLKY